MKRNDAISQLVDLIAAVRLEHPVRVGIDGVDCSGKTMLADELIEPLQARGREVIRASVDGFHNPREMRHRQGRGSPRGYYEDSFDLDAVRSCILLPRGPGGDLQTIHLYQQIEHFFCPAVGEVLVGSVLAHIDERQHGDGLLRRS